DAAIRNENPGLGLPALPIARVVRKEGSGTSFHFSAYLADVSPRFAQTVGKASSSPKWPGEPQRAEGSKGIADLVAATPGAIGYVEFNWVERAKLNAVRVRNAAGVAVTPGTASFRAAVLASGWIRGDFTAPLTNVAADGAWPITMPTYVILPRRSARPQATARAMDFFVWAFLHGDDLVEQSAFVRLPDRVQAKAFGVLLQVTDSQGTPLLKGIPMAPVRAGE
ncbi:MAG TPA: substrate-binding domain-containing protein, partial [Burkholderiaceae bacterium]|nr:substrate-binding domain-containing protein [Burkholderiaceae bacterium]